MHGSTISKLEVIPVHALYLYFVLCTAYTVRERNVVVMNPVPTPSVDRSATRVRLYDTTTRVPSYSVMAYTGFKTAFVLLPLYMHLPCSTAGLSR